MKQVALHLLLPGLLTLGSLVTFLSAHAGGLGGPLGPQKLLMVGGGDIPNAAVSKFVDWGIGAASKPLKPKVMVIVWSTKFPEITFHSYRDEEFIPAFKSKGYEPTDYHLVASPNRFDMLSNDPNVQKAARDRFLDELKDTTAVFFSGGDQRDAVKVLKAHPNIDRALRQLYERGIPFGGTSAGTALMSNPMIMGDDRDPKIFDIEDGFGLLPKYIMVDQHFIKRKRKERLGTMMLKAGTRIGLGVEEGGAVTIEGNRILTVLGNKKITLLLNDQNLSLVSMDEVLLTSGQSVDLTLPKLRSTIEPMRAEKPGQPSAGRNTALTPTSVKPPNDSHR